MARLREQFGLVRPDGRPVPKPKLALGYSFGTLHGAFVSSLFALREHDIQRMAQGEEPLIRHVIPQQGIYIGDNRNRIVKCFLRTDAEWLLQIDTDIAFPPDLPETMLALAGQSRKILAASVPLSWVESDSAPIQSCAMNRSAVPGVWDYVPDAGITEDGIEVDVVATAAVLIHRDVFVAIADQVGQCWFLQTGPGAVLPYVGDAASLAAWKGEGPIRDRQYVHLGEDVLFCMRAEDAGYRSYCVRIAGLRHYKVVPLSHDFMKEPATSAVESQEAAR